MSPSSPSLRGQQTAEEEAEECESQTGWRTPENQGLPDTTGLTTHMKSQRRRQLARGLHGSAPHGVLESKDKEDTVPIFNPEATSN